MPSPPARYLCFPTIDFPPTAFGQFLENIGIPKQEGASSGTHPADQYIVVDRKHRDWCGLITIQSLNLEERLTVLPTITWSKLHELLQAEV